MKTPPKGTRRMYDTEQFVRHELSNGIVVWLQKPSILVSLRGYLSVFFKGVGSFIDPRGLEGLAHFVEHAVFCGSRSRPSAVSLSMPIFENGGFINAVTDELFTEHWCEIGKEYFHHAVQTLFETLTEPLFDEEDLKIEKAVVIREINDYQNIGGKNLINEHAMRFIYGKGHPIVRKIRGYPSSVERISTKDVRDFFEKYYHAGSANIVCGGSFSCIPNVLEILEEHFGRMKRGESVSLVTPPLNFNLTGRHVFSDRRYGVDELNLHYLSPRISYPEFIAPKMLFGSLTCNLIAPLMLELREKRGIVYGVTSNVANTLYGSIAGMECFIHKDKFSEAEDIFLNMLKNIDSENLTRFKAQRQKERLNDFESSVKACGRVAGEVVTKGGPTSWNEHNEFEDAVSVEEMLSWRDKFLLQEPLILQFTKK